MIEESRDMRAEINSIELISILVSRVQIYDVTTRSSSRHALYGLENENDEIWHIPHTCTWPNALTRKTPTWTTFLDVGERR